MRTITLLSVVVFCLACGGVRAEAESPAQKCPVMIDRVELNYSHQGGQSKPELTISFGNDAGKRISSVAFSLSMLDSSGDPQPYPADLKYSDVLDAGKKRVFVWELAPESVDIHHAGETVVVKKVEFDHPGAAWKDDGSESCKLTVDYHAR